MQTGWRKSGTKLVLLCESNDGAMRTGFAKVGGYWYYFVEQTMEQMKNGHRKLKHMVPFRKCRWRLHADWMEKVEQTGITLVNPMMEQCEPVLAKVGGDWWLTLVEQTMEQMKTGWQKIDGTWYFFNDDGNV